MASPSDAGGFAAAVAELKTHLWGEVLLPSDGDDWKASLKAWSLPLKPIAPALAVRPRGIRDICKALAFAATHKLPVAVKGGGHSPRSLGLVQDGLVLDMSGLRGVIVDPRAKTAVAQGGALLGDIDQATAVYDLAVPLGHAPSTGMGLAVGGGMGVLKKVFGPTAQHIIAATVVTADGTVIRADLESDPELLWGVQGAGAALGVVAEVTFRLHDVSSAYAGLLVIPDDPEHKNLRAIARFMRDHGRHEPGYSNNMIRGHAPNGQPLLFLMLAYFGPKSIEEKAEFISPLRALGPVQDTVGKGRLIDMQMAFLEMTRTLPPHYEYWGSGQLLAAQVTDDFLDAWCRLLDEWPECIKALSLALFDMWKAAPGGSLPGSAEEEQDTGPHGLSRSSAEIGWLVDAAFLEASQLDEVKTFVHKMKAELVARGSEEDVYAIVASSAAGTEDALAARVGGAANLARLRALKARVDPGNMFKSHPFTGL